MESGRKEDRSCFTKTIIANDITLNDKQMNQAEAYQLLPDLKYLYKATLTIPTTVNHRISALTFLYIFAFLRRPESLPGRALFALGK